MRYQELFIHVSDYICTCFKLYVLSITENLILDMKLYLRTYKTEPGCSRHCWLKDGLPN